MNFFNSKGFSLIELSIVLVIFGLTAMSIVPGLRNFYENQRFNNTTQNMNATEDVLREFFGLRGRYPCPANPNLPTTDVNYGLEQCRASVADACPVGLICTNVGSRDANGDGPNDPVTIGALPLRTLADNARFVSFTPADGRDGQNMHISYAVSELMTDTSLSVNNPANFQLGAIALKDEFNNDVLTPADSAHYVIISHGDNSLGATSINGVSRGGCTIAGASTTDPPVPPTPGNNIGSSGIEIEKENCDNNDAIFVKGLRSMGDNDSYFDDRVYFHAPTTSALWTRQNAVTTETHLYNTNLGGVGIGVDDPTAKLHVNGNLKAETAIISDSGYCDAARNNCLAPEALAGDIVTDCPAGQAAIGFDGNDIRCADLFAGAINFTCPVAGEYVTGFSNLGAVTCAAP